MTITYRTAGAWGAGKGSNLTAAEVDENFWDLVERMDALEADPPAPNNIASITVTGTQMSFVFDDASVLGPFTLPVASILAAGEFADAQAYGINTIFTVAGDGCYISLQGHTTEAPFDPDAEQAGEPLYAKLFDFTVGGAYDVSGGTASAPTASQVLDTIPIPRAITFPVDFAGSVLVASSSATSGDISADYEIDVQDDGVSIGTITVYADLSYDFATAGGVAKIVAAGSILTFVGDASVPADLASVFFTLAATVN